MNLFVKKTKFFRATEIRSYHIKLSSVSQSSAVVSGSSSWILRHSSEHKVTNGNVFYFFFYFYSPVNHIPCQYFSLILVFF